MSKKQYETILVSWAEGITTIALNRPKVLNAMSPQLMDELGEVLEKVSNVEETRVVVITGSGEGFCAGGDVVEDVSKVGEKAPFEYREYIGYYSGVVKRIYWMEKPVIAAINGVAVGGGCDLAMACDIRIASDKARFGYGYVRMGMISEFGGDYLLPRLIGLGRAKLFAFTGELIDAKRAEELGLVDQLVPASEFDARVKELAQKLVKGPTKTIGLIKMAMNRSMNMDFETSVEYSQNLSFFTMSSEDHKEAYRAFLEKRPPVFKGR